MNYEGLNHHESHRQVNWLRPNSVHANV